MTGRRRRPRLAVVSDVASAKGAVLQKVEEELQWAQAYLDELMRVHQFITQGEQPSEPRG